MCSARLVSYRYNRTAELLRFSDKLFRMLHPAKPVGKPHTYGRAH